MRDDMWIARVKHNDKLLEFKFIMVELTWEEEKGL
jgi:hypothetical protein